MALRSGGTGMALTRRRMITALAVAPPALASCARRTPSRRDAPVGVRRFTDRGGEWFLPPDPGRRPTVVLIHGGFWQPGYTRHLEDAVAIDLAQRGYLVWNIDYRPAAAGWPSTLTDTAEAYDRVRSGRLADRVDRTRVAAVGHSAGGQLALWLASRPHLPPAAPGSPSQTWVRPALAVGQAPVAALTHAADEHLGADAAVQLCGGTPQQHPARYAIADPALLVPAACPVTLIHGTEDTVVPVGQSRAYLRAAYAAGGHVTLDLVPGGHFDHLDPHSPAVTRLVQVLTDALS